MKKRTAFSLSVAAMAGAAVWMTYRNNHSSHQPIRSECLDIELENRIQEWMEADAFSLFIQPVVDLKTGKVCGGDVLSQLHHPERGVIFPEVFEKVIHRMGLQVPFDLYVLKKSCAWLSRSRMEKNAPDRLFIRFSGKTLAQPGIARQIGEMVAAYGLKCSSISIEISQWEQGMDAQPFQKTIKQLRALGFLVCMELSAGCGQDGPFGSAGG